MSTLNQRLTVLEYSGNGSGTSSTPQVYFKVNSNLSTNQVFSSGTIAQFNNIVFCYPSTSDFNTTTYKYTVPVDGIYQFSFRLYPNYPGSINTDTIARFAINKNGQDVSVSGSRLGNIEATTILESCLSGDLICIRCSLSNTILNMYMSNLHSEFTGHLISTL